MQRRHSTCKHRSRHDTLSAVFAPHSAGAACARPRRDGSALAHARTVRALRPHTRRRLFMLCMHTPRAARVRLTARVRARAHPELWASCRRRASTPRTVRCAVPCCSLRVPARAGVPTTRTVRGDARRCTSHVPTRASVPAREGAWGQGDASRAQGGASRAREGRLGPGKGAYPSPTVP